MKSPAPSYHKGPGRKYLSWLRGNRPFLSSFLVIRESLCSEDRKLKKAVAQRQDGQTLVQMTLKTEGVKKNRLENRVFSFGRDL